MINGPNGFLERKNLTFSYYVPDDSTSVHELQIYDKNGNYIGKISLTALVKKAGYKIVEMNK